MAIKGGRKPEMNEVGGGNSIHTECFRSFVYFTFRNRLYPDGCETQGEVPIQKEGLILEIKKKVIPHFWVRRRCLFSYRLIWVSQ